MQKWKFLVLNFIQMFLKLNVPKITVQKHHQAKFGVNGCGGWRFGKVQKQ